MRDLFCHGCTVVAQNALDTIRHLSEANPRGLQLHGSCLRRVLETYQEPAGKSLFIPLDVVPGRVSASDSGETTSRPPGEASPCGDVLPAFSQSLIQFQSLSFPNRYNNDIALRSAWNVNMIEIE